MQIIFFNSDGIASNIIFVEVILCYSFCCISSHLEPWYESYYFKIPVIRLRYFILKTENLVELKWNESGFIPHVHILAELVHENLPRMVIWLRWACPSDTRFEIRALAVWSRARYLSVIEVSHNIESLWVSGEETFNFFETWKPERGSSTTYIYINKKLYCLE